MLGIFSTGATWATVSDNSSSTEEDGFFGDITVDVALNGDLQLTEMDSDCHSYNQQLGLVMIQMKKDTLKQHHMRN